MKYIIITGGVVSGIGKGVIASSTGKILQRHGVDVTFIKIDPYVNLDAGTLTPYDHGEVFVLSDGAEVDLDLGNYERFLNINLTRDNNITTGKIYDQIIKKERAGDYLGKTVQIVPHLTDLLQEKIIEVSERKVLNGVNSKENKDYRKAQVCIIELGGTVGDIESLVFIEALRQLKIKVGNENFLVIGVEYVPILSNGEQKTKPIQNSVKQAAMYGLRPDIIVARCSQNLEDSVKEKISLFCEVKKENIIDVPEVDCVFKVPMILESQNFHKSLIDTLKLSIIKENMTNFKFSYLFDKKNERNVIIALVGKYVQNKDCYISIANALYFSSCQIGLNLKINWIESENLEDESSEAWMKIQESNGILIPGGFGERGSIGKIKAIQYAREKNIPFFGICFGFQLAVVEYARNVLKICSATSEEFDENAEHKVVLLMKDYKNEKMGGTMRLGEHLTFLDNKSQIKEIYNQNDIIYERYRHRYYINPEYLKPMEDKGLVFIGSDHKREKATTFELPEHVFFIGVQFHPEFIARPKSPHCLFTEFIRCSAGSDL